MFCWDDTIRPPVYIGLEMNVGVIAVTKSDRLFKVGSPFVMSSTC